ncbi:unnamed protein product [Schistocephalus solidus]|uniref:Uncharacterized protein n=1 Tax=Schistocephalus solidus TaxID=70667 RepID=A0A183TJD1_SCHSO|nr:unnamed protein product [Schistocephalus solidus]
MIFIAHKTLCLRASDTLFNEQLEAGLRSQLEYWLKLRESWESRRRQNLPVELLPTQTDTVADTAGLTTETEYKPRGAPSLFSPTTFTPTSSLPLERNAADEQGFHMVCQHVIYLLLFQKFDLLHTQCFYRRLGRP